jgi:16S rRNA (guanine527-N7)-methyltransferase
VSAGAPGRPRGAERYLELLATWGAAVDLVGPTGGREAGRLLDESLLALPWLPDSGTLLDVGSGNGFPAVPLLLARPLLRGVLLEPRERRWAFLKEVGRELGLAVDVRRERAVEHQGGPYAALTCRGLAGRAWVSEVERLVAPGGAVAFWGAAEAVGRPTEAGCDPVLTFAVPGSRGTLSIWRRRST